MSIQIGHWARRRFGSGRSFVTKWHLVDSTAAGDIFTRCGRRMADKPDAPFQVSPVMPLTRMIGQPQNCRQCDPESINGRLAFEDDGSTAPTDDTP